MTSTIVSYAIYNTALKKFKGRAKMGRNSWTDLPIQTYDTIGRAEGAVKLHVGLMSRWKHNTVTAEDFVIIPITICYEIPCTSN